MGRTEAFLALCGILLVGGLIRLYQLGTVPHGLAWDEAAIGYNGFAILRTRRDEWLQRLPISFKSFGDYKAPLAIYINGPSTALFGMNPLGVRLPFALAGIVSIGLMSFVSFELWRGHPNQREAALLSAAILATSPWHIHYSRVAFESGLALCLFLAAVGSFLRFKTDQRIARQLLWILIAVVSASLSLYTYHSAKLSVPLFFIGLVVLYRVAVFRRKWGILVGSIFSIAILFPLLKDSLLAEGLTRANVTVFSTEKHTLSAIVVTIQNLIEHLQHTFLVLGESTSLRHGTGEWGVLLPTTFIMLLLALGFTAMTVLQKNFESNKLTSQTSMTRVVIALLWIITGLLPAAIGTEVPHSNRALLALPGFIFLAVEGAIALWTRLSNTPLNYMLRGSHGETQLLQKAALGTLLMVHVLLSVTFLHHYFNTFAANSASAFSDGYLEAMTLTKQYEKGTDGKPEVSEILFTDSYGQPYIYALFVRKTDPIWYQGGSLVKYQFTKPKVSDLSRQNALVVAAAEDNLPSDQADHIIFGSDGSIRFLVYKTPK